MYTTPMKKFKEKAKLTRHDAVKTVIKEMARNPASIRAKRMISVFGLTAEELSESGMTYEYLRSLDGIVH